LTFRAVDDDDVEAVCSVSEPTAFVVDGAAWPSLLAP
jgi:hypothetical protein